MSIFNSYVSLPEGIIICFLIFHLGKHPTIGDLPLERPWSRSASAKVSTTTATSSGGSDLFKEFFIENLRLLETISKSFKYYEKVDYIILWLFRRNCPGIVWICQPGVALLPFLRTKLNSGKSRRTSATTPDMLHEIWPYRG